MSREAYRSIGAIAGLALGIVVMSSLGLSGILMGALFGAGGCVTGAMTAEKLHDWSNAKG